MLGKQVAVAVQVAIVAAACWYAYQFGPPYAPAPALADTAGRLAYVAQWLLIPGLALLFGVGLTADQRFFAAEAIDGSRAPESKLLEINLRYNQNTLEQAVLAAIAWAGLALALPAERLGLVPVLAVLFGIGRILFFAGYLIAPVGRAIGFGFSMYPSAAALLWLAWRALA